MGWIVGEFCALLMDRNLCVLVVMRAWTDVWIDQLLISHPVVPNYLRRLRSRFRYLDPRLCVHQRLQWRWNLRQSQRFRPRHEYPCPLHILPRCFYCPFVRIRLDGACIHKAIHLGNGYFEHHLWICDGYLYAFEEVLVWRHCLLAVLHLHCVSTGSAQS